MRILVTVSVVLVLATGVTAEDEFTADKLETVKKNVEDEKAILIDVREQREWDAGHLNGAIFMPLTELGRPDRAKEMTKNLVKDVVIYTHCAKGKRAQIAAGVLTNMGYEVRPLKPGYAELIEAGFEKAK